MAHLMEPVKVRRGDALEALVWCSKDDQIHVAGGKPGVRRPPMATGTGKLESCFLMRDASTWADVEKA